LFSCYIPQVVCITYTIRPGSQSVDIWFDMPHIQFPFITPRWALWPCRVWIRC